MRYANCKQHLIALVVVSHCHKFIFLKTTKTAGTSIEVCLSPILPPSDSLSPIYPPVSGHDPRNYNLHDKALYNHMPFSELVALLGESIHGYRSWCVERHPLDKCLSHYAMLKNSPYHNPTGHSLSWDEYIKNKNFPVDLLKWSDGENIHADKIFDYDKIHLEIPDFLQHEFGIPNFRLNARVKSGFRSKDIPRRNDIGEAHKRVIMDAFLQSSLMLRKRGINFE